MEKVTCQLSVSLDGFVAGPDQSADNPLGIGGRAVHTWHIDESQMTDIDRSWRDELMTPKGAQIMGRNMYGPIRGEWDSDWRGWWGDEPPYHCPVFVLTHYPHDPIEMDGGTTFHFVTEGFDAAFKLATEVADGRGIAVAGGASTARQALRAGVVDELILAVAPVLLGAGERLFDDVGDLTLEPLQVAHSPLATHIRYRVGR